MTDPLLVDEPAPHVRQLTLNRPEQLNAMTAELCEALHAELRSIAADRSCRAVILTGAGRGVLRGPRPARLRRSAGKRRQRRAPRPARQPGAHVQARARAPRPAAAGDRGRQRPGRRIRPRADARLRHPLRQPQGGLPRGVHQHWRLQLRHGHELAAAAADRRLALARADAHRPRVDAEEALRIGLVADVVEQERLPERGAARPPSRSPRSRPGACA